MGERTKIDAALMADAFEVAKDYVSGDTAPMIRAKLAERIAEVARRHAARLVAPQQGDSPSDR